MLEGKFCSICKVKVSCCRGFHVSCLHQETKQWKFIPLCLSLLPFIFLPLYGTQCSQQHYLRPLNKFGGVRMSFPDHLPSKSHRSYCLQVFMWCTARKCFFFLFACLLFLFSIIRKKCVYKPRCFLGIKYCIFELPFDLATTENTITLVWFP